jgi:hypothetical protein
LRANWHRLRRPLSANDFREVSGYTRQIGDFNGDGRGRQGDSAFRATVDVLFDGAIALQFASRVEYDTLAAAKHVTAAVAILARARLISSR